MSKVWFITGASSGLGRAWAIAALDRGDRVAGAARREAPLVELADRYGERFLPLPLDVADRAAAFDAVARAHEHFGALDVIVNNAGYGQLGMIEELTEAEVRAQFDTNVFGALWVTQAALPFLREQRSGHIIQVSSLAGLIGIPTMAAYSASKWALEGFSQALAGEMRMFGVHVTIVEPGGFTTDGWRAAGHTTPLAAYAPLRDGNSTRTMPPEGDPQATSSAIFAVVDAEAPPLRLLLGAGQLAHVTSEYESRMRTWQQWDAVAEAAEGEGTEA